MRSCSLLLPKTCDRGCLCACVSDAECGSERKQLIKKHSLYCFLLQTCIKTFFKEMLPGWIGIKLQLLMCQNHLFLFPSSVPEEQCFQTLHLPPVAHANFILHDCLHKSATHASLIHTPSHIHSVFIFVKRLKQRSILGHRDHLKHHLTGR